MDSLPDGAHHRSGRALRKQLKEDLMGAIVCGVDDSESASEAARAGRVLSAKFGHRIVFVGIVHNADPCQKISVLAKRLQHLTRDETDEDQQREVTAHGAGLDLEMPETREREKAKLPDTRDFAGGIVRFSLGSRTSIPDVDREIETRADKTQ